MPSRRFGGKYVKFLPLRSNFSRRDFVLNQLTDGDIVNGRLLISG
jgi:hypothetical protein